MALFAGMAAAMIVPPVRRSVPRWAEALVWLGLIVTCWLAVTNIQQANTRYLTESAAWGADQIVNTTIGLLFVNLLGWLPEHRFAIANAGVVLLFTDILLLALVRSHRKAKEQQPRILLGEWIELPLRRTPAPAGVPYAMDDLNRRAEHATAMLGAAFLTWLVQMLIWTRDVVVPRATARQARAIEAGRVHAASGLESLRERTTIQLQAAARAWRTAHAPAITGLAAKAGQILDRVAVGDAALAAYGGDRAMTDEQVINVRALLSAQSIGWYGPIVPAPAGRKGSDRDEGQGHESDRLAS
ncbi:MAG TPA: hypothetical protein VLR46_03585 [Candidatus Dormibacteraeota bacterium]|nr:hypothetical protein [Candidatus Dormibacteraeota bacterium]